MSRSRVRRDSRGLDAVATSSGVASAIESAADAIADNVRAQGIRVEGIPGDVALPVTVRMSETDRAHATVALAHPSGEAVQAKHGALTKAAGQSGLEVRARS